jgi:hypothetical protein
MSTRNCQLIENIALPKRNGYAYQVPKEVPNKVPDGWKKLCESNSTEKCPSTPVHVENQRCPMYNECTTNVRSSMSIENVELPIKNGAVDKKSDVIYECPSTLTYAEETRSESENKIDYCMSMQNSTFLEMQESDTAILDSLFSDSPQSDNFVTLTHKSQSVSEELNKTRPNKPLTYVNPGCYKRRITNFLLSTLENLELKTPIQNSTKQELINTFKSKRFQIIKDFLDFTAHVQKICVFDQNYRRNEMRRVKRKKPNKLRLPIENVQNTNECFTLQINKEQLIPFDGDLFLRLTSENLNYDICGEKASLPS